MIRTVLRSGLVTACVLAASATLAPAAAHAGFTDPRCTPTGAQLFECSRELWARAADPGPPAVARYAVQFNDELTYDFCTSSAGCLGADQNIEVRGSSQAYASSRGERPTRIDQEDKFQIRGPLGRGIEVSWGGFGGEVTYANDPTEAVVPSSSEGERNNDHRYVGIVEQPYNANTFRHVVSATIVTASGQTSIVADETVGISYLPPAR